MATDIPRILPGGIVVYEPGLWQAVTKVKQGRTAGKRDRGARCFVLELACGHKAFRMASRGPAPKRVRCTTCLEPDHG